MLLIKRILEQFLFNLCRKSDGFQEKSKIAVVSWNMMEVSRLRYFHGCDILFQRMRNTDIHHF